MLKPIGAILGCAVLLGVVHLIDVSVASKREARWVTARDSLVGVAGQYEQARQREAAARQQAQHLVDSLSQTARDALSASDSLHRTLGPLQTTTKALRGQLRAATKALDSLPVLVRLVTIQDSTIQTLTDEVATVRSSLHDQLAVTATLTRMNRAADSAMVRDREELEGWKRLARTAPIKHGKLFGVLPYPRCGVGVVVDVGLRPQPGVACILPL